MSRRSLLAAVSFSHLFGAAAKGGAEDEDDRKDARRAEDGDKDENQASEEDQDDKDARRAEGGDEDKGDEDESGSKRSKKARRAEGDDDDADAEDDKDEDAKAARGRERSRCMAIFATKAAGKRPDMAAHFAFNTNMTRRQAIDALEATVAGMPAPRPMGLSDRMADYGGMRSSADAPRVSPKQAVAASWDAAGKRAGISR